MTKFTRSIFYAELRKKDSGLFGTVLFSKQVTAMECLLDAMAGYPLDHVAHVLAEVYHETGGGMWPVKETVYRGAREQNPSDALVSYRLERAWQAKKLPWVSTPYWRDGWFGRGQIQLTHEYNYRKASALVGRDLIANRDLALEPNVSAQIAAEGCRVGLFTGHKLMDYTKPGGFDHYNARSIVNGDKKVNGRKIEQYALAFTKALEAARWTGEPAFPPDVEPVPQAKANIWGKLIQAIRRLF